MEPRVARWLLTEIEELDAGAATPSSAQGTLHLTRREPYVALHVQDAVWKPRQLHVGGCGHSSGSMPHE